MLLPATPQFRRKRGSPKKATNTAPPGPTPLTLVSAGYDSTQGELTLVFSRSVNMSAVVLTDITVNDPLITNLLYDCDGGFSKPSPSSVKFSLNPIGTGGGAGARLNASPTNGIVATGDAQPWPGCTNLPLPFP
jgi:hypothetical protein